jgi:hypothetical protein
MTYIPQLVPVDAEVDKAEHIAHEDGPQRNQHPEIGSVRDFEFQHHDGDDAVAAGFEPVLADFRFPLAIRKLLLNATAVTRQDFPTSALRKTPYARISKILLKHHVVECPTNLHPY